MAKLLQIGLDRERILESIVVWEDVVAVTYNPQSFRFAPHKKDCSAPQHGALHDAHFLHQETSQLKKKLAEHPTSKTSKASSPKKYLETLPNEVIIKEFMDEAGPTKWMVDLSQLLLHALDEEPLDDLMVKIEAPWKWVTTEHCECKRKYHRGHPSGSPKKEKLSACRKGKTLSPRIPKRKKGQRHDAWLASGTTGSGITLDSGDEIFYRGSSSLWRGME